jgi:alpha-methylacyl-CoA racemase
MRAAGAWHQARGTNRLDSGAHFYDVYETADGRYVSVGSLEPRFYAELRARGSAARGRVTHREIFPGLYSK